MFPVGIIRATCGADGWAWRVDQWSGRGDFEVVEERGSGCPFPTAVEVARLGGAAWALVLGEYDEVGISDGFGAPIPRDFGALRVPVTDAAGLRTWPRRFIRLDRPWRVIGGTAPIVFAAEGESAGWAFTDSMRIRTAVPIGLPGMPAHSWRPDGLHADLDDFALGAFDHPEVHFQHGRLLEFGERFNEALEAYDRALAANAVPLSDLAFAARIARARVLTRFDESTDQGLVELADLTLARPVRAEPFIEMAEALIRHNRHKEARSYLDLAAARVVPAEQGLIIDTAAYGARRVMAQAVIALHDGDVGGARRLAETVLQDLEAPEGERIRAQLLGMLVA